eukprot:CAMPEP_0115381246 /NCGR_PEP_ID=MMETSP0271-20121206/5470_1 /TAXON_ID=71861 /ORGANISM="Scrippsiella trochoidea, Strain CCMP3099" /LENGTH=107 /DNA_ID=CAMNT_0002804517 /DNA_START=632 /DNA_END=955 /DNA_ORIENTATION=-
MKGKLARYGCTRAGDDPQDDKGLHPVDLLEANDPRYDESDADVGLFHELQERHAAIEVGLIDRVQRDCKHDPQWYEAMQIQFLLLREVGHSREPLWLHDAQGAEYDQ